VCLADNKKAAHHAAFPPGRCDHPPSGFTRQIPKHVVKPGYRSRQFPGFLNKPPDLFCLVIRGLIFSAAFFRLLCLGVLFHCRSVPGSNDNP